MTRDKGPRDDRRYLNLMAPNTKGPKFAWLDPTSIYINGEAFLDLLDDLVADLDGVVADVVGGLDAMRFVLGAALATRLGVGFLPIRKADRLCDATDRVGFASYSGRTQEMEMRLPAFAPGTRVLLVDQWIETGGTMDGAIRLVERQGGIVVGVAAVAIEENPVTAAYRQKYRCAASVVPGSRWQAERDAQKLTSFATYRPELAFPRLRLIRGAIQYCTGGASGLTVA
jgi:adenine phosphoribosyltransferase